MHALKRINYRVLWWITSSVHIPLKDSHLFKIVESVISFYFFFLNSNSAILNRYKSFSRMVDYVTYPPCRPYNFSLKRRLRGRNYTVLWWTTSFVHHSTKNFHLFKFAESIISFCFKKFFNSTILNWWKSLSGMIDRVTCSPWETYNF